MRTFRPSSVDELHFFLSRDVARDDAMPDPGTCMPDPGTCMPDPGTCTPGELTLAGGAEAAAVATVIHLNRSIGFPPSDIEILSLYNALNQQ